MDQCRPSFGLALDQCRPSFCLSLDQCQPSFGLVSAKFWLGPVLGWSWPGLVLVGFRFGLVWALFWFWPVLTHWPSSGNFVALFQPSLGLSVALFRPGFAFFFGPLTRGAPSVYFGGELQGPQQDGRV